VLPASRAALLALAQPEQAALLREPPLPEKLAVQASVAQQ